MIMLPPMTNNIIKANITPALQIYIQRIVLPSSKPYAWFLDYKDQIALAEMDSFYLFIFKNKDDELLYFIIENLFSLKVHK
jgi:hypothetical protein